MCPGLEEEELPSFERWHIVNLIIFKISVVYFLSPTAIQAKVEVFALLLTLFRYF